MPFSFFVTRWHRRKPLLSHISEPVPLPHGGEEQRRGEDPSGERGRGVEGLLRRRVPGDSGWVCHEIRRGVHLSGHDVSTNPWSMASFNLNPSVIVTSGRAKETREKERGKIGKKSPQQYLSFWRTIELLKFDWLIAREKLSIRLNWSRTHRNSLVIPPPWPRPSNNVSLSLSNTHRHKQVNTQGTDEQTPAETFRTLD